MTTMDGSAFCNGQLDTAALPSLDNLNYEPVSPAYRKMNLIITTLIFSILFLIVSAIRFQPFTELPEGLQQAYPFICAGLLFFWTWIFFYHWFADRRIKFALREQDISLSEGLIFRSVTCQPVLRVQHIEIKRGPVDRMAGLAKLQVFSAGGVAHTFEIPGLPVEQAQKIRRFILEHKDVGAR